MWATVWCVVALIESLLFIVLLHGGAIDMTKATEAVNASVSKLVSLFKRKES